MWLLSPLMPVSMRNAFCRVLSPLLISLLSAAAPLKADDWPQWLGPQRDGVWRESGIVETFPKDGPRVRWRAPVSGGFAGPAVAKGRVYVHDHVLAKAATRPTDPFARGTVPGTERLLCLSDKDGTILWTHEYDCPYTVSYGAGPRATPVIHEGKVYALGAEGNLFCLDAEKGKVLWSHALTKDYNVKTPLWGFAGHPLIDGNKLICLVGGQGSVAVAFDKDSGKELWRALTAKEPGYCPPMIYEFGGKRHLIIWHPEAVNGLEPETGKVLWTHTTPVRSALSIATPRRLDGDRLFLSSFYNGSLMLRIRGAQPEVLWQSKKVSEKDTDMLHTIMGTPVIEDGHIYGCCSYGEFRCLKADTGERVWETFAPTTGKSERWANAFVVKHESRYFLFNEQGDLIIAKLTPQKYEEISRAHLIEPTNPDPGRPVVWSHPAFANRSVYVRNDKEIVCASLVRE
jgi:outer membrane protein assembly factor BamB